MAEQQTIGVPQLILLLVVGAFAIRYFFFSSPSSPATRAAAHTNNIRAREADVERIQQMFPQTSRRCIMWDLQRNGGNVAATTERILSGRGLETPPQSFQPPLPSPSSSAAASAPSAPRPSQPDLITRYNLKSKLAEAASPLTPPAEAVGDDSTQAARRQNQAWSSNKGERQALLQRRREEMILAARKKMESRVAQEALSQQGQGP